jgi:hypothetical protein
MDYEDFGLPDDGPAEQTPDLAAQLAEARAAKDAADKNLAELQRRHGTAAQPAGSGSPAPAAGQGVDLDALVARVGDRSVPWETLQSELAQQGFADARPAGRRHGMRGMRAAI